MFKPRFSLKAIILGTNTNFSQISSNAFCQYGHGGNGNPAHQHPFIKMEKCLVVSKLSRFEFERNKLKDLNDIQFEQTLRDRGTNYEKLIYYHNLHKAFEKNVADTFRKAGIQIKVVNRFSLSDESVQWADVVLPTGGDGTFLLAASRVRDNKKPVIGFNSDPNRSEGHLCLPKYYSAEIGEAIERLKHGKFEWLLRSRIRTTLTGQRGDKKIKEPPPLNEFEDYVAQRHSLCQKEDQLFSSTRTEAGTVLPFLALNEVFMGECLSARVSHLEMRLNGDQHITNMKCSGLCVSTGTGSTSWHLSINRLPAQSVAELLRLLELGNLEGEHSIAQTLADIYNKNLIFAADDKRLGYTIRDLISAGVWPQPKGIRPRGFASNIQVKSCCYDAGLVIDGGISYNFNDGTLATLEICPEDALRTVIF